MPVNMSTPICSDPSYFEEQYASRVSQTEHCQTDEFDHALFCHLSSNYTCSLKFPVNCNASLGKKKMLNSNVMREICT